MGINPRLPNLAVQDRIIHSSSWGAAAFGPVYLLAMRAYAYGVSLSLVIILFVAAQLYPGRPKPLEWLPGVALAVAWLASAMGGKRVAWRTRRWRDFADFLACQQAWDRWGRGGFALAAVLIAVDWLLRTVAPTRGLRARQILDDAIMVALGAAGTVAAWWYVRQHHQRLHAWQQLGLRALTVASALICAVGIYALLHNLYLPDAADISLGASMFLAGLIVAVASWQYGRRTARRLWWLRLSLRLLVLPAAFVAATGAFAVLSALRLPESAAQAVMGLITVLGLLVVVWPDPWRRPQAVEAQGRLAANSPVPRGVHLRTALDAVALMARRPILVLPLLVAAVIQGELGAMLARDVPSQDSQDPWRIILQLWPMTVFGAVLNTYALTMVSHVAAQVELAQRISFGAAVRRALIRLPAALGASLVFFVRIFVGFLLLIVPGVIAFVRGALLPPAVVLGNAGPYGAFRLSADLLRGHWWPMFLLLAAELVISFILTSVLGKIPRVGYYVSGALVSSWIAITLTILYLRLGGPVWEVAPKVSTAPVPVTDPSRP